jgi:formiminotetrahydrofolate cyclodeaminase
MNRAADESRSAESPGAGPAAAASLALAAAVVVDVARQSAGEWDEAPAVAAQAEALRSRSLGLARSDLEAYTGAREALAALGAERQPVPGRPPLGPALERAAAVPLEIAEAGVDIATLAAVAAERCPPDLRADAAGAALIATGAVGAVARLLEINLSVGPRDERLEQARQLVGMCELARERAIAASG